MSVYSISDRDRSPSFDARVELDDTAVLLHSRGGSTGGRPARNTDYERALETIIRRLRHEEQLIGRIIDRVLIDSLPARHRPIDERILVTAADFTGLTDAEAVSLIRRRARAWGQGPDAQGGNSTRALRIETRGRSHASIRSALRLRRWDPASQTASGSASANIGRLPSAEQRRVLPAHIDKAVRRLLKGDDAPNFGNSRDYDVIAADGTRLAPKKVFGIALEEALGIEAHPAHFSAGWGQPSFLLIEAAGYRIVQKGAPVRSEDDVTAELGTLPYTDEDRFYAEGDTRMISHLRVERRRNSQAAKDKRAQVVQLSGRLVCEMCESDHLDRYPPEVASGCFEIHHRTPLASIDEARKTRIEDLACLCATCHRAVHRQMTLHGE